MSHAEENIFEEKKIMKPDSSALNKKNVLYFICYSFFAK